MTSPFVPGPPVRIAGSASVTEVDQVATAMAAMVLERHQTEEARPARTCAT